jgi:hypothetical protein
VTASATRLELTIAILNRSEPARKKAGLAYRVFKSVATLLHSCSSSTNMGSGTFGSCSCPLSSFTAASNVAFFSRRCLSSAAVMLAALSLLLLLLPLIRVKDDNSSRLPPYICYKVLL